jgi:hypothetical protein
LKTINIFLEEISMNTLSRQMTARFFTSPSDFDAFRRHWSQLVNSERKHQLKAVHHLAYFVLCGRDWRKAFTFPTNPNKLNNGYTPELIHALQQFRSGYQEDWVLTPFDGLVSSEALAEARTLLSHVMADGARVNADGVYLCDAYTLPVTKTREE